MNKPVLKIFAVLMLGASAATLAQLPPAPPIAEPKPFQLPSTEDFTLPNGLAVTLIPYGIAPKAVISLRVRTGNLNEGGSTWLADTLGELLSEGAAGKSAAELATATAGMGGNLDVGVSMLTTNINLEVLSEHVPAAVGLVADVAIRPTLPASELERVKANLARTLAESLAQPGPLADAALARTIYGKDHPYGRHFPAPQQLAGYTIEQVKAFHAAEFGARRARLYIAGKFDAAAVKKAVTAAFGAWAAGPAIVQPSSPHAPGPRVILVDRPGAPQTTLRLAFDAPQAGQLGDVANRTMNELLGGAFSSRITTNIRENKGYTYSPGSGITFLPGDALWVFDADVTTAVTGASLKEIFGEIRRLQNEAPGDEEGKGIRTYIAGLFAHRNSTSGSVLNTVATRDLLGLPADWLTSYVPAVLATTNDQLRESAAANLPLAKLTLVAIGDLKKITPQLKALPELKGVAFETTTVP